MLCPPRPGARLPASPWFMCRNSSWYSCCCCCRCRCCLLMSCANSAEQPHVRWPVSECRGEQSLEDVGHLLVAACSLAAWGTTGPATRCRCGIVRWLLMCTGRKVGTGQAEGLSGLGWRVTPAPGEGSCSCWGNPGLVRKQVGVCIRLVSNLEENRFTFKLQTQKG